MANKSAAVKRAIGADETDAADDVAGPKHRYKPSASLEVAATTPPWLRIPVMSPLRRARRTRWWPYLAVLGPGIVAAAAGNDAGGIATYAVTGATYGYKLLWTMLIVTICLVMVQEMCARMGAVTGKGLADLIREQFGAGWTVMAILLLLIANAG